MLIISGIDDLYIDLMYWFLKKKHRDNMPDFSEMYDKAEKPIAIMLGAWNESGVIGRTLSFAINNLKYSNYRIFVGVYPNDRKTIDVVSKISETDKRVKMVINPQAGPSTKADNLNCMYSAITDFEKKFSEFEIILVHDAEDFIHPKALKLYNFLIGYKGYHGIQIPVVPIKSTLGKTIHRTYCDAFAETHTKDMIIRQELNTFLPFSGTGMGFHRKAMYSIEKLNSEAISGKSLSEAGFTDPFRRTVAFTPDYFQNEEKISEIEYYNNTGYKDNPFRALSEKPGKISKSRKKLLISYSIAFTILIISTMGLFYYTSSSVLNKMLRKEKTEELYNYNGNIIKKSADIIGNNSNIKGDLVNKRMKTLR